MSEDDELENDPFANLPEISPKELADWLKQRSDFLILDVREPYEFSRVKLDDPRVVYAPLSELARKYFSALPQGATEKTTPLVVMCHHGNRSAQVTAWLIDSGWQEVYNLAGGIDAYARQVDHNIGFY